MTKDISEFLPNQEMLEGERIEKDDLKGKVITVTDFAHLPSSYEGTDEFVVIQIKHNGVFRTFSGGIVLNKKFDRIDKSNLPFNAKLVLTKGKKGRFYWDMVSSKE